MTISLAVAHEGTDEGRHARRQLTTVSRESRESCVVLLRCRRRDADGLFCPTLHSVRAGAHLRFQTTAVAPHVAVICFSFFVTVLFDGRRRHYT